MSLRKERSPQLFTSGYGCIEFLYILWDRHRKALSFSFHFVPFLFMSYEQLKLFSWASLLALVTSIKKTDDMWIPSSTRFLCIFHFLVSSEALRWWQVWWWRSRWLLCLVERKGEARYFSIALSCSDRVYYLLKGNTSCVVVTVM